MSNSRKAAAAEIAAAKEREQEALAELEKALAEARLKGQNMVDAPEEADTTDTVPLQNVPEAGTIDEEKRPVKSTVGRRTAQRGSPQGEDHLGLFQHAGEGCP